MWERMAENETREITTQPRLLTNHRLVTGIPSDVIDGSSAVSSNASSTVLHRVESPLSGAYTGRDSTALPVDNRYAPSIPARRIPHPQPSGQQPWRPSAAPSDRVHPQVQRPPRRPPPNPVTESTTHDFVELTSNLSERHRSGLSGGSFRTPGGHRRHEAQPTSSTLPPSIATVEVVALDNPRPRILRTQNEYIQLPQSPICCPNTPSRGTPASTPPISSPTQQSCNMSSRLAIHRSSYDSAADQRPGTSRSPSNCSIDAVTERGTSTGSQPRRPRVTHSHKLSTGKPPSGSLINITTQSSLNLVPRTHELPPNLPSSLRRKPQPSEPKNSHSLDRRQPKCSTSRAASNQSIPITPVITSQPKPLQHSIPSPLTQHSPGTPPVLHSRCLHYNQEQPSWLVSKPYPLLHEKSNSSQSLLLPSRPQRSSSVPPSALVTSELPTATSHSQTSIICRDCGKCRCRACSTSRPLPSCWICCGGCLCSCGPIIDAVTCMCCVKACVYHTTGERISDTPQGIFFPCHSLGRGEDSSISGPSVVHDGRSDSSRALFCTWAFFLASCFFLPCMWCYYPLKGCELAISKCYAKAQCGGCHCRSERGGRSQSSPAAYRHLSSASTTSHPLPKLSSLSKDVPPFILPERSRKRGSYDDASDNDDKIICQIGANAKLQGIR